MAYQASQRPGAVSICPPTFYSYLILQSHFEEYVLSFCWMILGWSPDRIKFKSCLCLYLLDIYFIPFQYLLYLPKSSNCKLNDESSLWLHAPCHPYKVLQWFSTSLSTDPDSCWHTISFNMWPLTISPYDSYNLVNSTSWGFPNSSHASSSDFPNWNSPQPLASGELVFNNLSLSIISSGKCSLTLFSFKQVHVSSLSFLGLCVYLSKLSYFTVFLGFIFCLPL